MKKRKKTSKKTQLPKSFDTKKRSRREVSTTSSDFLHLFEIILDRLIQLFTERFGKLLLGLGGDLLGAAVDHAFCHSVHQIAPLHEKIIESLAAVLLVLPLRLCPLVIFKSAWSGTALRRKCGLYPGNTVCAILALKVLQNLKQFTKHGCFLLLIIFEYALSSVEAENRRTPWGLYLFLSPPRGVPDFRWNYTESTK